MPDREQQFEQGQKYIFDKTPELVKIAHQFITRFDKNPQARTMILKSDNLPDLNNLFLNNCARHNDRVIINIGALKECLNEDFMLWLATLKKCSDYQAAGQGNEFEEFYTSLGYALALTDWSDFKTELKRDFNIYGQSLKSMLQDAVAAADYLGQVDENLPAAELGARLYGDSKRLRNSAISSWAARLLKQRGGIGDSVENKDVLSKYGLTGNPTASLVTVFGPFVYECGGRRFTWIKDLWELGQSAVMNYDNVRGMSNLEVDLPVLTVENESSFNRMKADPLGYALIYTAGFPGKSVMRMVKELPKHTVLQHWGDSDPEGLEIAAILHRVHPLRLFRCDRNTLARHKERCIPLKAAKLKKAERLAHDPEFPFAAEIAWCLENQCWLEQENYLQ